MGFRILLVDDDEKSLERTKFVLQVEPNLEIHTAGSADEAVRLVKASPNGYAAILLDYQMPGKDGAEAAREILGINPHLVVAINSGDLSREALKKSWEAKATDFIEKDGEPAELRAKIRAFCRKFEETSQAFERNSTTENEEIIRRLGMIGCSQALVDVARIVERSAPTDCNVMIRGESGTGKELVARAFHNLSSRRTKPFVAINVGAIPENLLESDLFGHEKGAFTGADRSKMGKIKFADGGTLFLDEIGEMKPDLQVKLLRFLQEGEITPVGSLNPVKVNVRVVAATHRDLEELVRQGAFREDLFFRLNVLEVCVPALRERPDDIAPLVEHFQKQFKGERKTILMKTFRYLERYSWKGNVRELRNEMEKLMTIVAANRIEPSHLSGKFFESAPLDSANEYDCTYEEFMRLQEEREKEYLRHHLRKGRSLRETIAHGMHAKFATIHGRMKRFGLIETKKEKSHERIV